jgi:hypothetical protein
MAPRNGITSGSSEIEQRLERLGVHAGGRGRRRRAAHGAELPLAGDHLGEIDDAVDDFEFAVAHGTSDDAEHHHAPVHLARREDEKLLAMILGTAQHLDELDVHTAELSAVSHQPPAV